MLNTMMRFNKAILTMPMPWPIWMGLLILANLVSPLFFLGTLEATVVLVGFAASVTLELSETGEHVATCEQPSAQGHGLSPTNALDQLRRELRYQLELCPCSGIDPDSIEFE